VTQGGGDAAREPAMRLSVALAAIAVLGVSATVVADTAHLDIWDGFTAGPAFFPFLVGAGAAGLAVALLVQIFQGRDAALAEGWPEGPGLRRVAAVYATLVAFTLLVPVVGILAAAAAMVAFITVVILRRPVVTGLGATAASVAFLWLVFARWLALPLPKGPWGF